MAGEEWDFSVAPFLDRADLLADAAERLDALAGHLGDGDGGGDVATEYGDLLRAFAEDRAEFGPRAEVLPVAARDLPDGEELSPQWRDALDEGFTFWRVRLPLLLFPRRNWAFNRLEVAVEASPGEPDARRAVAYDILPDRRFETLFETGADLEVKIGGDGRFSLDLAALGVPAEVLPLKASASAKGKADLSGGFRYKLVKARVSTSGTGNPEVFWRLDGAGFFQETAPDLMLILQVPREAAPVRLRCAMQAYRRFNLFPAGFQAMVRELPKALRVFLAQGAPLARGTTYELGPLGGRPGGEP